MEKNIPRNTHINKGSIDPKDPRFLERDHDLSYSSYGGGPDHRFEAKHSAKRDKISFKQFSIGGWIWILVLTAIFALPILSFVAFPVVIAAASIIAGALFFIRQSKKTKS